MSPFNTSKFYNQLNHLEEEEHQSLTKTPKFPTTKKTLAITFLTLLTLILISIIGILIYSPSFSRFDSATRSIRFVCNVTRYPISCFSSLSSINTKSKPDPEFLFSLSLQSAINELKNLVFLPESLSFRVNDSMTRSVLNECKNLFSDALDRINQSASVDKGHVASSPDVKISDINTWISAAMSDVETCLDGLDEIGSTVVDEIRVKVQSSNMCMSNSLAILVNIKSLVDKFHKQG